MKVALTRGLPSRPAIKTPSGHGEAATLASRAANRREVDTDGWVVGKERGAVGDVAGLAATAGGEVVGETTIAS